MFGWVLDFLGPNCDASPDRDFLCVCNFVWGNFLVIHWIWKPKFVMLLHPHLIFVSMNSSRVVFCWMFDMVWDFLGLKPHNVTSAVLHVWVHEFTSSHLARDFLAIEVQTYDHLITEFQFWVCEVVLHHLIMDVPGRSQEGCFWKTTYTCGFSFLSCLLHALHM